MSSKNKFNEEFTNRVKNHEFQFDPAAWSDMEGLLDQDKPKRRFPLFFFFTGFLVIAGILFTLSKTWNQEYTTPTDKLKSKSIEKSAPEKTIATKPLAQNDENKSTTITIEPVNEKIEKVSNTQSTAESRKRNANSIARKTAKPQVTPPNQTNHSSNSLPIQEKIKTTIPTTKREEITANIFIPSIEKLALLQPDLKFSNNAPTLKSSKFESEGFKPTWDLHVIAGASVSFYSKNIDLAGTNNYEVSSSYNINPIIGLGLRYQFHPNFYLQPEFHFRPFYFNLADVDQSNRDDLIAALNQPGSISPNVEDAKLVSTRMIGFDVPILLNYRMTNRSNILAGLRTTFIRPLEEVEDVSGVNNLDLILTDYDFALILGYSHRLSRDWNIDLRYNYSMVSDSYNSLFNKKRLFSDIQLTVRKTLFN